MSTPEVSRIEEDRSFLMKSSLVWSIIEALVGIVFIAVAVATHNWDLNIFGAILICSAMLLAIGSSKKIWWLFLPEIGLTSLWVLCFGWMCIKDFYNGVYVYFADTNSLYQYAPGIKIAIVEHFRNDIAAKFILLGFVNLFLFFVASCAAGMINMAFESLWKNSTANAEASNVETADIESGQRLTKLEDIDV